MPGRRSSQTSGHSQLAEHPIHPVRRFAAIFEQHQMALSGGHERRSDQMAEGREISRQDRSRAGSWANCLAVRGADVDRCGAGDGRHQSGQRLLIQAGKLATTGP